MPPAELLLERPPRSKLDFLKPNLSQSKIVAQKNNHVQHSRCDINVYVNDFPNARKWLPGKIIKVRGSLSYFIELNDGRVVCRLVDAVRS